MTTMVPTRPRPPEAVQRPPASRRHLVLAIAAVEGRRILRHPVWWLGVVVASLLTWVEAIVVADVRAWRVAQLAELATAMTLAAMVVAHAAATRPHRDDVTAQHVVAPARPADRRLGLVLAQVVPAVVACVWIAVAASWLAGDVPGPWDLAELAHVFAWVLLGGVLGVALARVAPWPVAGTLGAVVVGGAAAAVAFVPTVAARLSPMHDWREASTWPDLVPRSPGMHLAWVAGLVLLVAALACLDRETTRFAAGLAATGVAVAAAAGIGLVSVWTGPAVDRFITAHDDPAALSVCEDRADWIQWCSPFGGYDEAVDPVVVDLRAAASLLPDDVDLTSVTIDRAGYSDKIRESLPGDRGPQIPTYRAGHVELGPYASARDLVRPALLWSWLGIGFDVPELSEDDAQDFGGCALDGQARGAILLAVADLAIGIVSEDVDELSVEVLDGGALVFGSGADPFLFVPAGAMDVSLSWEQQQVAAELVAGGSDSISRLHADWEHWMDPSTPVDDLVEVIGVDEPTSLEDDLASAGNTQGAPWLENDDVEPCT